MKTIIYYCFLAFAAIALSACSAEDGKMGPAGPQGEQGPPGEDGNANVIYSDWFALDTYSDKHTGYIDASTVVIIYTFDVPEITQEVIDRGSISVYFSYNGELVRELPIPDNAGISLEYFIEPSKLTIWTYDEGNSSPPDHFLVEDAKAFRYVIVPGGTPAQAIDLQKVMAPTNIQQ